MKNCQKRNYSRSRYCKYSGFTLVELLVIIAILCILASLLMPGLKSALESTYLVKCANNLRNVGVMGALYADDNRGYITPSTVTYTGINDPFINRLKPYGIEPFLKQSPSYSYLTCPSQITKYEGFNHNLWIGMNVFRNYVNLTDKRNRYVKLTHLPKASSMVYVGPILYNGLLSIDRFGIHFQSPTPHFADVWVEGAYSDAATDGYGLYGQENLLFFDGRVKGHWWCDQDLDVLKSEFNPN